MKNHIAKLICGISLLLPVTAYAGEANAMYSQISIDGKSSAMGGVKSLDTSLEYLNAKSLEISMSSKKQMGIIPYSAYEFVSNGNGFAGGIKLETSEDYLKTSKVSVGLSGNIGFLDLGGAMNFYSGEIATGASIPEDFEAQLLSHNISYGAITAKTNGMGFDVGARLKAGDIGIAYYMKNLNAKLKWTVTDETPGHENQYVTEGQSGQEENYEENLSIERIIALSYKKNEITVITELENFEKINIGFQRNYYNLLNLRAGISRNIKSSENLKSEKSYSIGVGFEPKIANIVLGIDFGYQIKYYGRDDLGGGVSQDDMAITTRLKF